MRTAILLTLSFCWTVVPGGEQRTATDLFGDPLPPGATARLGTARFRTTGEVRAVAITHDGQWVAWAGESGLRVAETAMGKPLFSTRGRGDEGETIQALEFSADGRWLLAGGDTGILCLWDLKTWKERLLEGHAGAIVRATFSPDGQRIASCDEDGTMILWDVPQGLALMKRSSEEEAITTVAFSPDGLHLACGHDDGKIRLLDVQNFEKRLEVEGHGDMVTSLAFSSDGRRLVSGGGDNTVRCWEAQTLRPFWAGETGEMITTLAFTKDNATVLTSSEGGYVHLWDAESGQLKRRHLVGTEPGETSLFAMAIAPDGKTVYCGGDTPNLRILDTESGLPVERCAGHRCPATQLLFAPDSRSLVSGSEDGTVRVWDVNSGRQKFCRSLPNGWVSRPAFSPDGKRVAVTGMQVIHIWDAESGAPVAFAQGSSFYTQQLLCSPDGRGFLTAYATNLELWSFEDGRKLAIGLPPEEGLDGAEDGSEQVSMEVVFDGRTLVASGDKVRCIDLNTGRDFHPEGLDLDGGPVSVSPDGRWLVGFSADGLAIYETASFRKMLALDMGQERSGEAGAFSADNRFLLICATAERNAVLLDTFSGKKVGQLDAGDGYFVSARTSPDGQFVALGHSDTTILIYRWDTLVPDARASEAQDTVAQDKEFEAAYADLGGPPEKVFAAIGHFLQAGAMAVGWLDRRMKPVCADQALIDTLVSDLNNDDFSVREKATTSLLALGLLAEAPLRKARADVQHLEVQKRLDAILRDLMWPLVRSGELLRNLRVIGILESIGSKEAREALVKWVRAEPGSIEGQAAQSALDCLNKRRSAFPDR